MSIPPTHPASLKLCVSICGTRQRRPRTSSPRNLHGYSAESRIQTRYETYVNRVTHKDTFRVHVKGPPNGLALIGVSYAPLQAWALPIGDLWLDLNSMLLLGAVALDAQGWSFLDRTAHPLAPIDRTYVVQAGLLDPLGTCYLAEPMFFGVQAAPGQ